MSCQSITGPEQQQLLHTIEAHLRQHNWGTADTFCQQALNRYPASLTFWIYSAWIAQCQGQTLWAIQQWQRVLGMSLKQQQLYMAIYSALALYQLQPDSPYPLVKLFEYLGRLSHIPPIAHPLRQQLLAHLPLLISQKQVSPLLARTTCNLFAQDATAPETWCQAPDFLMLMCLTLIPDLRVEQWGIQVRRKYLLEQHPLSLLDVPLLAALACQLWLNEYLWPLSKAEQQAVEQWRERLQQATSSDDRLLAWLILALVEPLWSLPEIENEKALWPTLQQLRHYQYQACDLPQHRACIPHFGSRNPHLVQDFYETWPYPRWHLFWPIEAQSPREYLCQLLPALSRTALPTGTWHWLIAGCGTGQDVLQTVLGFFGIHVVAIDFSLNSLAQAHQLLQRHRKTEVEWWHGDVMELNTLEQSFDVIQTCGVLHHLDNPLAGLQVLVNQLRPGGLLKLMVYRRAGRILLQQLQAWCREHGLHTPSMPVSLIRQHLLEQSPPHLLQAVLSSPDFFCTSGCHDLLFHVQETSLSLSDLAGWFAQTGLTLLGFECENPILYDLYRQDFSDEPLLNHWDNWQLLEVRYPLYFGSTYTCWAQKPIVSAALYTQSRV